MCFPVADLLFSFIMYPSWIGKQRQEITAPKHRFGKDKNLNHGLKETELLSALFI